MKEAVLVVLAAVGAYAVWTWWQQNSASQAGQVAQNQASGSALGAVAAVVSPNQPTTLTSGIPRFDNTVIANGHGDQYAANFHSNDMSVIEGSGTYQPAFGPNENRDNSHLTIFT